MAVSTKKSSTSTEKTKARTTKAGKATAKPKTSTKAKAATKSTTSKKAITTKATARKAPAPLAAPEPIAAAPKVDPVVVTSAAPKITDGAMRKEQLLDEVAKRSGAKRKDVKPIVEAALEVLGEAIGDGQELNLKPLGKMKIARTKHVANGRVINLRLRQSEMVIKELDSTKKEAAE